DVSPGLRPSVIALRSRLESPAVIENVCANTPYDAAVGGKLAVRRILAAMGQPEFWLGLARFDFRSSGCGSAWSGWRADAGVRGARGAHNASKNPEIFDEPIPLAFDSHHDPPIKHLAG